jgi:hypothetical protein
MVTQRAARRECNEWGVLARWRVLPMCCEGSRGGRSRAKRAQTTSAKRTRAPGDVVCPLTTQEVSVAAVFAPIKKPSPAKICPPPPPVATIRSPGAAAGQDATTESKPAGPISLEFDAWTIPRKPPDHAPAGPGGPAAPVGPWGPVPPLPAGPVGPTGPVGPALPRFFSATVPCENWHREVPCGVELNALLHRRHWGHGVTATHPRSAVTNAPGHAHSSLG